MHQLARRYLARRRGGTLQATDLVHEAYLRLADPAAVRPPGDFRQSREEYVAAGARIMRRLLARRSRRLHQVRRAEARQRDPEPAVVADPTELLALAAALGKLARYDPRRARIVRLHSLMGLEAHEIATLLEVAPRTVEKEWSAARAWLRRELSIAAPDP